jgi:hypothetical protein
MSDPDELHAPHWVDVGTCAECGLWREMYKYRLCRPCYDIDYGEWRRQEAKERKEVRP